MCPHCNKSDTFYTTKGANPPHLRPCDNRIHIYVFKNNKLELTGTGKKHTIPKRNVFLCYECNKEVTVVNNKLVKI